MSIKQSETLSDLSEWDFCEDEAGVVYCLGRNTDSYLHEAVAVYERADGGDGTKLSLDSRATYNRIMYHGFPEEQKKLDLLNPATRAALLGKMSLADSCLYVDPRNMSRPEIKYKSISHWLDRNDGDSEPFQRSLEIACNVLESAGVPLEKTELYGGASFGLVGALGKWVDDIDFLVEITSEQLLETVERFSKPYTWDEIDPTGILSDRRKVLKAKRWSTSQLRLHVPDFLSIDLKVKRAQNQKSLWDCQSTQLVQSGELKLKVLDDSEAFSISPALLCEDKSGQERVVLLRGYPYVGTAIKHDVITVKGKMDDVGQLIVVSQSSEDILVPNLDNTHLVSDACSGRIDC